MTTSEKSAATASAACGERKVAVEDAAARLAELLAAVEGGETVTITRDGKPVARLVRARPAIIEEILAFRDAHPLEGITIRELIEEGRRY